MKLQETKHRYYCEIRETQRMTEYECWKDFKEDYEGCDWDYNFPFRFDINKSECDQEFYLTINHALQRHGCELWHVSVRIVEEDMVEIEQLLKEIKQFVLQHWEEVGVKSAGEPIRCTTCQATLSNWLLNGDRVEFCGYCGNGIDWSDRK